MPQADPNHSTAPLSALFSDPLLRDAFARAERDQGQPLTVTVFTPRTRDGGAVEQVREAVHV